MQQHLGKAQFVAGRYAQALRSFERALRLRVEAGAEGCLVACSRAAVECTRELLSRPADPARPAT